MSHVDFNLGVYYPVSLDDEESSAGGMGVVVDGIAELGAELGVEYLTDSEVEAIRGEAGDFRVELTSDGDRGDDGDSDDGDRDTFLRSDFVVSNADYAHTEQELLAPEDRQYDADYWNSRTYAPSAFLLYLGVEGDVDGLEHHSLVLPADWNDHFDRIFEDPAWPDDPAYYLCVPSETDDAVAPEGHSNLFALVPIAPGLDDSPETRQRYRDLVLDDIAENADVDLRDRIVVEETFCVADFTERYNSIEGTALGLAHTLRQTGPLRPGHRSSAVPGLYFTGSFTTPGIGVPMCLISGLLTSERMAEREAEADDGRRRERTTGAAGQ
jgi:phytoene desaturase